MKRQRKNTGVGHSSSSEDVTVVAGGQEPQTPPVANTDGESNGTQEHRHDTTLDMAMGENEGAAVSMSSVKSLETSKQHRETLEEKEVPALADAQVGEVKASISKLPSVREKKGQLQGFLSRQDTRLR